MLGKTKDIRERYLREEMWPSIFCTGCGVGNVLNYTLRAIDRIGLDIDRVVFCSGIGCSSWMPGPYVECGRSTRRTGAPSRSPPVSS
jgi:2-oxoglutarate ferredoxin oxidoreductase subunit beta